MNEVFKRSSIRSFNDKNINLEDLKYLCKCGMNAPSAHNKRSFEFVIINSKDLLTKLTKVSPYYFMLEKCSSAIIVCGKEETIYFQQDCAAATENILLSATSKNISSCWLGVYPEISLNTEIVKILSLPNDYKAISIIALGYTDKPKEENDIYEESKIHINKYGE